MLVHLIKPSRLLNYRPGSPEPDSDTSVLHSDLNGSTSGLRCFCCSPVVQVLELKSSSTTNWTRSFRPEPPTLSCWVSTCWMLPQSLDLIHHTVRNRGHLICSDDSPAVLMVHAGGSGGPCRRFCFTCDSVCRSNSDHCWRTSEETRRSGERIPPNFSCSLPHSSSQLSGGRLADHLSKGQRHGTVQDCPGLVL